MRMAIGFLTAASLLPWGLGCRNKGREVPQRPEVKSVLSVVDALGKEIHLQKAPERLISLAPSITEILFALGLGDKVVGVTSWDNYPPEVAQIERVGDYGNPNLEKIMWLKPDLILVTYGVPKPSIEVLEKRGLTVVALPDDSLADVVRSVRLAGKACGAEKQGQQLAFSLEERIAAWTATTAVIEPSQRPRVLYLVSLNPLMCVGADTFIDDMVTKAGGVNAGARFGKDYPTPSPEVLLEQRPDVVLLAEYVKKEAEEGKEILRRVGLSDCRTYTLPDDLIQRPGPRAVDGLELMVKVLHPGRRVASNSEDRRVGTGG